MQRTARLLLALILLLGAGVAVRSADDEAEKTPRTHLGHFRAGMEDIRFQIINAGARVKGGAVSMEMRGEKLLEDTPATRCCAVNVVGLEKHLTTLVDLWKELHACYVAEANSESEVQLNFVRADAGSLVRAFEHFRNAKRSELLPAQQAMTKAFMLLEETVAELDDCGDPFVR